MSVKHRSKQFTPSMEGATLEVRVVPATVVAAIPFVVAPPGEGIPQFALNFTSHTYHQMINGGSGQRGISQVLRQFRRDGNPDRVLFDLARVSQRVPFGRQELLPIWQDTLTNLPINRANRGAVDAVQQLLRQDLRDYANSNVGVNFNVLLSNQRHNTQNDLIYNGRVGDGPGPRSVFLGGSPVQRVTFGDRLELGQGLFANRPFLAARLAGRI